MSIEKGVRVRTVIEQWVIERERSKTSHKAIARRVGIDLPVVDSIVADKYILAAAGRWNGVDMTDRDFLRWFKRYKYAFEEAYQRLGTVQPRDKVLKMWDEIQIPIKPI